MRKKNCCSINGCCPKCCPQVAAAKLVYSVGVVGNGKNAEAMFEWKYCGNSDLPHEGDTFTLSMSELQGRVDRGSCEYNGQEYLKALDALNAEHDKYCDHCGGEKRKFAEATFVGVVGKGRDAKAEFRDEHCGDGHHAGETFTLNNLGIQSKIIDLEAMIFLKRTELPFSTGELIVGDVIILEEYKKARAALKKEMDTPCSKCGGIRKDTIEGPFLRIVGHGKKAEAEFKYRYCDGYRGRHAGDSVRYDIPTLKKRIDYLEARGVDVYQEKKAIKALEEEADKYCECGQPRTSFPDLWFLRVIADGIMSIAEFRYNSCCGLAGAHVGDITTLELSTIEKRIAYCDRYGWDTSELNKGLVALKKMLSGYCPDCGGEKRDISSKLVFVEVVGKGRKAKAKFGWKYCHLATHVNSYLFKDLAGVESLLELARISEDKEQEVEMFKAYALLKRELFFSAEAMFVKIVGHGKNAMATFVYEYSDGAHCAGENHYSDLDRLNKRLENRRDYERGYNRDEDLKAFEALEERMKLCECGGERSDFPKAKFKKVVGKGKHAGAEFELTVCYDIHCKGRTINLCLYDLKLRIESSLENGRDVSEEIEAVAAISKEKGKYCDPCYNMHNGRRSKKCCSNMGALFEEMAILIKVALKKKQEDLEEALCKLDPFLEKLGAEYRSASASCCGNPGTGKSMTVAATSDVMRNFRFMPSPSPEERLYCRVRIDGKFYGVGDTLRTRRKNTGFKKKGIIIQAITVKHIVYLWESGEFDTPSVMSFEEFQRRFDFRVVRSGRCGCCCSAPCSTIDAEASVDYVTSRGRHAPKVGDFIIGSKHHNGDGSFNCSVDKVVKVYPGGVVTRSSSYSTFDHVYCDHDLRDFGFIIAYPELVSANGY